MIAVTLALAIQTTDPDTLMDPNGSVFLARCTAAEQIVVQGLMRLEQERGVDMSDTRTKMARFAEGIAALAETARLREGLSETDVARLRDEAGQDLTGQPLAESLRVMDACESAHEVMD